MLLSVPILRVDKQGPDGMELSPSNGCETALNAGRLDPETAFCYLTHTHTHTRALRRHTHPHTSFMLSLTHTAVGGSARLLWPKIRGAIINHDGLPLVKSSLSWREQNCMGAQQRPFARWHPEAHQFCHGQTDGWTMIRRRLLAQRGRLGHGFHG